MFTIILLLSIALVASACEHANECGSQCWGCVDGTCVPLELGTTCDDGLLYTIASRCQGDGRCVGTPSLCYVIPGIEAEHAECVGKPAFSEDMLAELPAQYRQNFLDAINNQH